MTEEPSNPVGRPSLYTPELAEKICLLIAEGLSLRHIEAQDGMPTKTTILAWCIKHDEFADQYARAKERQAEAFAEEILDIADDAQNDWIERENQRTGQTFIALNEEAIARSKLRVEARKWLMGKMKPKKYGDKTLIGSDPDNPLPSPSPLVAVTPELIRSELQKIRDEF